MEKFSHSSHKTRIYRIWCGIKRRCNDPENPYYGGKGVAVCEEWANSFERFLADMGEPEEGQSLDRIDPNKGYSPDNCRWASYSQQQNNRSNNVLITLKGETHTAAEWAELKGLNAGTIRERIRRGWPPEQALLPRLKSRHDRPKRRTRRVNLAMSKLEYLECKRAAELMGVSMSEVARKGLRLVVHSLKNCERWKKRGA